MQIGLEALEIWPNGPFSSSSLEQQILWLHMNSWEVFKIKMKGVCFNHKRPIEMKRSVSERIRGESPSYCSRSQWSSSNDKSQVKQEQ